jgi:hypothetical protein
LLESASGARAAWSAQIANIVPKKVYDFQNANGWGDFHIIFHMQRKWWLLGQSGRNWLKSQGAEATVLQEGYEGNGVEFLAMHRCMIEYLRQNFGNEPVTNDPDGRKTFGEVLTGWNSDDQVFRALSNRRGADAGRFRDGLATTNNFADFEDEDEFGNFLQTTLRAGDVEPGQTVASGQPAKRAFTQDNSEGAGVHNWLHGQFMEVRGCFCVFVCFFDETKKGDSSPIDVGNPQNNLGNIMFWRIHGWIEWKWQQFEKSRTRSPAEKTLFDQQMNIFRKHMVTMSSKAPPSVPNALSQNVRPTLMTNKVDCSRLTPHTVTVECPNGPTAVQTTPRVNTGTVCVHDTVKITAAEKVLAARRLLNPSRVNGVWDAASQVKNKEQCFFWGGFFGVLIFENQKKRLRSIHGLLATTCPLLAVSPSPSFRCSEQPRNQTNIKQQKRKKKTLAFSSLFFSFLLSLFVSPQHKFSPQLLARVHEQQYKQSKGPNNIQSKHKPN